MPTRPWTALLACLPLLLLQPVAAETPDDILWKIRREAAANSHILRTLHVLTDVHGPRLTGSPNLEAAGRWAIDEMTRWGLTNGRMEPWDFGHPGWANERFTAHVVSPVKDALVGEVLAWTPGTDGPVRAGAIQIDPPSRPTKAELSAYLDGIGDAVKGRAVLVGKHEVVPVTIDPPAKRLEDADAASRFDAVNPAASPFSRLTPPSTPAGRLTTRQATAQIDEFLVARGAALRVNDGGRDHGQIRAFSNRTYDVAKAVPTMILRSEDYGRISRLLAGGRSVELEVDIVNRVYPEGKTAYNVVAEIPGSDKAAEVVMLGGHLDSWHAATGATDNAIGVAVMMEAARILKAIGVTPRRTIRVALWSGEEQGLLGSKAYVAEHFGTAESPKPAFATFGGYFNIDSGTGRARGFSVFGPGEAAAVLREATRSFRDLGFMGVTATESRRAGGTDSTSFNAAGLPGIGTTQDPIEYQTHSWHTNLDTYERVVEGDAIKSATVIAAAVYALAMRDELLPRFPADGMPKPPAAPAEDRPSPTAP